jgi:protein O-GlcNAc transferase
MSTKTRLQLAAELLGKGRLADAKARLVKELRMDPQSASAAELLGAVLFELGSHTEAIEHLRQAMRLAPSSPGPRLNLGKALLQVRRFDEAAEILADAIRRWPRIAAGRHSYGNALLSQGKPRLAIDEYRAAIELAPEGAGPYENLAMAFSDIHEHEAVVDVCQRLLALDPSSVWGEYFLVKSRQMLCAWEEHDARLASLARIVQQKRVEWDMAHTSMLLWDSASLHRSCADLAVKYYSAGSKAVPQPKRSAVKSDRIRIAYVSADFRRHPVARLVTGLIEAHDRSRFEIVGIPLGKDDGSRDGRRMAEACDRLLDMRGQPVDLIVRAMREEQIDIAVDLTGYTENAQPGIFIQRSAPIQVSYLGFPGTSGIAAMDYLIVDPFIASGDLRDTAAEKLVILPDCYLCNDVLGRAPAALPSRSSFDLPEAAFVFCSFNDAKKLTPAVFDQWMRILRQVEGSVLWLRRPRHRATEANLRAVAERCDVDPVRIVFADRVSDELHTARNGVPDLHLDTFPYNAHTIASDALRAGCPILTRTGTSFPARVCASLLTTIGVAELITYSADEYEAMAVRLARDRALLADLRQRVGHGRTHSPLFDPARFARNLERAYEAMVALSRAGKPPAEINVGSLAGTRA